MVVRVQSGWYCSLWILGNVYCHNGWYLFLTYYKCHLQAIFSVTALMLGLWTGMLHIDHCLKSCFWHWRVNLLFKVQSLLYIRMITSQWSSWCISQIWRWELRLYSYLIVNLNVVFQYFWNFFSHFVSTLLLLTRQFSNAPTLEICNKRSQFKSLQFLMKVLLP